MFGSAIGTNEHVTNTNLWVIAKTVSCEGSPTLREIFTNSTVMPRKQCSTFNQEMILV